MKIIPAPAPVAMTALRVAASLLSSIQRDPNPNAYGKGALLDTDNPVMVTRVADPSHPSGYRTFSIEVREL